MSLEKYLNLIDKIDFYIRRKATGNLSIFSKKLQISKRTLLRHLKVLKKYGFPIKYDKKRNSYFYSENGKLTNSLFDKGEVLNNDEKKKIYGGKAPILKKLQWQFFSDII